MRGSRWLPRLVLGAIAGLLVLVLACVQVGDPEAPPPVVEEPDEPLTIRLIHGSPMAVTIALMAQKTDILPNYGTEYVLETDEIIATSQVATLLAAGEGDLGMVAAGPMVTANTGLGADIRVVADIAQGGVEGHEGLFYMVLEDSGIETVQDLRGRTLGTLGLGTFTDMAMRVLLQREGIDPERDVDIVEVSAPAMEAAMREGRIDMGGVFQPFFHIARENGNIRLLFTSTDAVGPVQALFLGAREEFLEENPRRVQAFFDDYYVFLQWALDPANRDEMIEIGSGMMMLPPEAFPYFRTHEDWYRAPDGMPNVEAIQEEVDLLAEFGVIDEAIDISGWVNLSFMEQAGRNAGN